MKKNLVAKPASQNEIDLFCFIGEALCKIQVVEQALSHSIALKTHSTASKEEADKALNKNCSYTLGKAIKIAQDEKLFSSSLQDNLTHFLEKRNWLVHKVMAEGKEDINEYLKQSTLFQRIKAISNDAMKLQHEIELDMVNFCTAQGRDMSKVLAIINERYSDE